jgi:signal peptidase II
MNASNLGSRSVYWLLLSTAIVVLDQVTKMLVIENMTLYQRVQITSFFDLVRLHNTGAAFSFLADASGWQNWLFTGIAVVVSVGILYWLVTLPAKDRRTLAMGLALVLGGAVGNVIDRSFYGYVVDFILLHYQEWSYPAFNIADSAITCGVILILYDGVVLDRRRQRAAS